MKKGIIRKKILFGATCLSMLMMMTGCGEKEEEKKRDSAKGNVKVENTREKETEEKETEEKDTKELSSTEGMKEEKDPEGSNPDKKEINLEKIRNEGKSAFETCYDEIVVLEDAESFTGNWNRTNTVSALGGNIVIEHQDEEGFEFQGELFYYSHMGWMEGKAYYLSQDTAIYRYDDMGEEYYGYIIFQMNGDKMEVIASDNSTFLDFGANVFADGEYVDGEPVYTNATILEDTFTQEELDSLKSVLGETSYEEGFAWVVRYGVLNVTEGTLEDGTNAKYYEAFVPTMGGYGFELLMVEDGRWYYLTEMEGGRYNTNVSGELDFPTFHPQES